VLLDDAALQVSPSAGSLVALGSNPTGNASAAGGASVSGAADSQLGAPGAQSNAPQIMLLSNGDTNAFELTILRDSANRRVTLKSASDGTISAGDIVDAPQ
jgi:hypothetical protein